MGIIWGTAAYNINFLAVYKFMVIGGPDSKTFFFAGFLYTFRGPVADPGKLYFHREIFMVERNITVAERVDLSYPTIPYDSNSDLFLLHFLRALSSTNSAPYEERTKGPAATAVNPIFIAVFSISLNSSGV